MEKDWSNLAKNFDDLQKMVTGEAVDKIIKSELSKLKDLGNLLELGCGNGNYTKTLAPNSTAVLSTDISEDMVEVAKEKLKDFSNVIVQTANCYETDLDSSSYDSVFMANLIHIISEPQKAIDEVRRILKDNGRFIIISFTGDGMSAIEKIKLGTRYIKYFGEPPKTGTKFSLATLKEFVSNNNFIIEDAKLLGEKMSKAMLVVARKV